MQKAASGSDPPPADCPRSDPPRADAPQSRDPLIGLTIAGRFRVLSIIARGGMGKVYRAEQLPLGRICALKVLNPKYQGDEDPEFQKRFFLEASTASKLTHPNTVTIFDYGRDGDTYYIAMEYIEGRTLYRVLREDGPFAEERVARVLRQVCRSLREAHAMGVIHRDMKPANVVLADKGDELDFVKVLDFGLVKDVSKEDKEDLTQQGLFMGSPKYMSPEQILGNPVSPRTDIYALGVLAFEMLSGQVPFDRGTSVKTLMAHVQDRPPLLEDVFPEVEVTPAMRAIVYRCLEKSPGKRFADTDELLAGLSHVEGGAATSERPIAHRSGPPSSRTLRGPLPELARSALSREVEGETQPTSRSGAPPSAPAAAIPAPVPVPIAVNVPSVTPEPLEQPSEVFLFQAQARRRRWLTVAGLAAIAAAAVGLAAAWPETPAMDPAAEMPTGPATPAALVAPRAPEQPAATPSAPPVPSSSAGTTAKRAIGRGPAARELPPQPAVSAAPAAAPPAPVASAPPSDPAAKTPKGYKESPY